MNALTYCEFGNLTIRKPNGLEWQHEQVDKPELGFEYDNFGNELIFNKNVNFNNSSTFNNNSTFNNRVSINDILEGNNNTLTIDADIINNQFLQAENQELNETILDNYNQSRL